MQLMPIVARRGESAQHHATPINRQTSQALRWLRTLLFVMMASPAQADWPQVSPRELANQADLIIQGELIGSEIIRPGAHAPSLRLGVIRPEKALKSAKKTPELVFILLPPPRENDLIASSDILLKPGQKGLWLLKRQEDGLYRLPHPDSFIPTEEIARKLPELKVK